MSKALTGTFNAVGQSVAVLVEGIDDRIARRVNMTLSGAAGFTGSVQPEISFDNGATWIQVTDAGAPITRTGNCTDVYEESEQGVLYRWNCTACTAGSINWRISY